jgi:hypothetical protein
LSLILGIGFVFFLFSSFSGSQGEVNLEHEIGNDVFAKLGGKHVPQKHIPIPDPVKHLNSQKPKPIVTDGMKIETRFGDLVFQFHPEAAPKTVAQTKKAVKEGYFDGNKTRIII